MNDILFGVVIGGLLGAEYLTDSTLQTPDLVGCAVSLGIGTLVALRHVCGDQDRRRRRVAVRTVRDARLIERYADERRPTGVAPGLDALTDRELALLRSTDRSSPGGSPTIAWIAWKLVGVSLRCSRN